MGKNSLVKSTAKKKAPAKKKDAKKEVTAAKKAAAAPKAKAAAKVAVKPKAMPKAEPKAKPKAAPKPKAQKAPAVKAKKAAPKIKKKVVSLKDLVHKKFGTWKPAKAFAVEPDETYRKNFVAPPVVSGTDDESRQIKALLLKKFDIAEMKAAAGKASPKKTAPEKTAPEKTAEEKPAEPRVPSPPPVPPADTDFGDPMDKTMKYFILCLLVLICLVIGASAMNSSNYYIETADGSVEIWEGRFAPMGKKLLISLPGAELSEPIKETYSRLEVSPIVFHYYVEKADSLLDVPGMPDFEGIKAYLNKAMTYATTRELAVLAEARTKNIDLMILLYKAEVASSRGTQGDLETARSLLNQAARLNPDDQQKVLISQKSASVEKSIEALKSKQQQAAIEAEVTEASTHKK